MTGERPWFAVADGVAVDIRLTPKGGRDAIDGVTRRADGRLVLKARVRAAPSEGEANAALCALLARTLGVASGKVAVTAGATSRIKRIRIEGEPAALMARMEQAAGDVAPSSSPARSTTIAIRAARKR